MDLFTKFSSSSSIETDVDNEVEGGVHDKGLLRLKK